MSTIPHRTDRSRLTPLHWIGWLGFYLAVALVGRATRPEGSAIALVWPAAGVAVLWLLRSRGGGRAISALAIGAASMVVNTATGAPTKLALALGAANLVHALVTVSVFEATVNRRWFGGRRVSTAEVGRLVVGSCVGALASLPFGLVAWTADEDVGLAVAGLAWLLRYSVVTIVVVSVPLAWRVERAEGSGPAVSQSELAAMSVATGVAYSWVFFSAPGEPLAFLVLPISVWVALRAGPFVTTVHGLVTATVGVVATMRGRGPFGSMEDVLLQSMVVQAFVGVVCLVTSTLGLALVERRLALRRAEESGRAIRSVLDSMLIGHAVIRVDAGLRGEIEYANPALELWTRHGNSLAGRTWMDVVVADDRHVARAGLAALREGHTSWRADIRHRAADGSVRWCDVSLARLGQADGIRGDVRQSGDATDDDATVEASLQVLDVTPQREITDRLSHQALHDDLTGLPNRILLRERLELARAMAARSHRRIALLFMDLDGFKQINDLYGHAAGNTVLREVARRLGVVVRPGDTVARVGGDEFVVCCPEISSDLHVADIVSRIVQALHEPMDMEGRPLEVGASIGIALAGDDVDIDALLRDSDAAMYVAKQRGRGRVQFFEHGLLAEANRRMRLANELRAALDDGQFELHYQPVVDLDGGAVVGVEALARWRHPRLGLLPPAEWMDVAEHNGLMVEFGRWTVDEAVRQVAGVRASDAGPLRLHLNVTAGQVEQAGMTTLVEQLVRDRGFDPRRLTIEIKAGGTLGSRAGVMTELRALTSLGVVLAIDDVGADDTSLQLLATLPVGQVKIDRSLVSGLVHDHRTRRIVQGVLGMARAVGLSTVAEGVETSDTAVALRTEGCLLGQGYLWSRPGPWDQVEPLIGRRFAQGAT